MLTGEKIMPRYKREIFTPCTRDHSFDGVAVRVEDLAVDLSRPEHREKSPVVRTGDVS